MAQLKDKERTLSRAITRSKSLGLSKILLENMENENNHSSNNNAVVASNSNAVADNSEYSHITKTEELMYDAIKTPNYRKALVKAVLLEVSVAVHSIIIGFDLGTIGPDEALSLEILMAAFAFHQFFEGISLGTAITETSLPMSIKYLFAINFALTFPIGVIIGMFASTSSGSSSVIVQGSANAIAAGSLLYSSLVEMIAEDFEAEDLEDRGDMKFKMFLMVGLGCSAMAILAIWA